MEDMHKLREMLCKELHEYTKKNELSAGSLDVIHKITDTIKNLDKIEMLEGGEEYSEDGMMYRGGSSYAPRRGSRYVHGYYRRGGGESYDGDESYDGGGENYSGRRYSRDDGKEHMMHKLREMMEVAQTEHQRDAIRKCMDQLEKA